MRTSINTILLLMLLAALLMLNYQIWFSDNGISKYLDYQKMLSDQQDHNNALIAANAIRNDQVAALKYNQGVLEQSAREDLGMIKPGEHFMRF